MAKNRELYKSKILKTELITPNLRRLTVDIAELENIDSNARGGYIKLAVMRDGEELKRSISIAEVDTEKKVMALDFVNHGGAGPAAQFAREATVNSEIAFYGPGPRRDVDTTCSEYIFVGDMTAFPALKAQLELMRERNEAKKCHVIVEAKSSEDFSYFSKLEDYEHFDFTFIEGNFTALSLLENLKKTSIDTSKNLSLWCAGERLAINEIRGYLRENSELNFEDKYTSSYWQCGLDQSEHSKLKKTDVI
ncbi:hypothetical protein BIY24_03670 [Halobacteriovorax marinus]|uniref:siderophore-interacting protein n=1 Tax=Halobacteriovorax marinus TaxID=97084 RepID=UPI000BC35DBA|nr:siderophore-interacting protein [Halobacteriovorax marinus]ATH07065.1 hypothetical protein BIY24_03670 [Halobacteriovorax marinus]